MQIQRGAWRAYQIHAGLPAEVVGANLEDGVLVNGLHALGPARNGQCITVIESSGDVALLAGGGSARPHSSGAA